MKIEEFKQIHLANNPFIFEVLVLLVNHYIAFFMNINPQYTFDNAGNPIGVFLPLEEWELVSKQLEIDIPNWQQEKVLQEKQKIDDNPSLLVDWNSVKQQLTKQ